MRRLAITACWLVAFAAGARYAPAADAQDAFNELYGAEYKRVLYTRDTADDVALADKLLKAAEKSRDQPALLAVLCEKVWELAARDASALPTLTKAARLLEDTAPKEMDARRAKLLGHVQRLYATSRSDDHVSAGKVLIELYEQSSDAAAKAGDLAAAIDTTRMSLGIATSIRSDNKDRLREKLAGLIARQKTMDEVSRLQTALVLNPADKSARQRLVSIYVVDLDDPAAAARYVDRDVDEKWRRCVLLAAKEAKSLKESACLELGEWYREHAEQNAGARVAMLVRARGYYEQYIRKHTAADLAAKQAELTLADINETIAKLAPELAAKPVAAGDAVKQAVDKGVKFLVASRREDGTWSDRQDQRGYQTMVVTLALLESGVSAKDQRVAKAMESIGGRRYRWPADLGLRLQVWSAASKSAPGAYKDAIRRDAAEVEKASRGQQFVTRTGGRRLRVPGGSANQEALLGVELSGSSAGRQFWEEALKYWQGRQRADGGWATREGSSDPAATAGAVVSMLICQKHLGKARQEAIQSQHVAKGLQWLEKNHAAQIGKPDNQFPYDYLQALARLGAFANSRKFGEVDWFASTSKVLQKRQQDNGSWAGDNPVLNAARAVMFLAVGSRTPSQ